MRSKLSYEAAAEAKTLIRNSRAMRGCFLFDSSINNKKSTPAAVIRVSALTGICQIADIHLSNLAMAGAPEEVNPGTEER